MGVKQLSRRSNYYTSCNLNGQKQSQIYIYTYQGSITGLNFTCYNKNVTFRCNLKLSYGVYPWYLCWSHLEFKSPTPTIEISKKEKKLYVRTTMVTQQWKNGITKTVCSKERPILQQKYQLSQGNILWVYSLHLGSYI